MRQIDAATAAVRGEQRGSGHTGSIDHTVHIGLQWIKGITVHTARYLNRLLSQLLLRLLLQQLFQRLRLCTLLLIVLVARAVQTLVQKVVLETEIELVVVDGSTQRFDKELEDDDLGSNVPRVENVLVLRVVEQATAVTRTTAATIIVAIVVVVVVVATR